MTADTAEYRGGSAPAATAAAPRGDPPVRGAGGPTARRLRSVISLLVVGAVFGFLLPRLASYGDVWTSLRGMDAPELALLSAPRIAAAVLLFRALAWFVPIPLGIGCYLFWRETRSWRRPQDCRRVHYSRQSHPTALEPAR
jgi:hypothetical protein